MSNAIISKTGEPDLRGLAVAITGANSGVGLHSALGLARRGANLVLICRSRERGTTAQARIAAETGATPKLLVADLADMNEVRRVAGELSRVAPDLRVLVNNAGTITTRRTMTSAGHELTIAVNHLAPFVLSTAVLDLLRANAPARIVNINSDAHLSTKLDLDDLNGERRSFAPYAYGPSKLANMLFTVELAQRIDPSLVTVNALHPGLVATDFGDVGGLVQFGWTFMKPFAISPERGARTPIYCASSPELDGITGQFFIDCRPAEPNPIVRDPSARAKLWSATERLLAQV